MNTIMISYDLILETEGTVSGLDCGLRKSGVTVARQGDAPKIHLIVPEHMRYAPSLHALVIGMADARAVKTTSDGRIVVDPRLTDPHEVLARIEAACSEERGRGGVPDGRHGVYDIEQSREGWQYLVQTTPSGRASLKRIAQWTGIDGRFLVPFSESPALVTILERAVSARVKGETTTIQLPEVPGVMVRIEGGEILVRPDREDNDIVRAVPSIRWDPDRRAYAVSTRYSKRVARALDEIKARMEERAAKRAEAKAAAQAEIDRIEADAPRIRTLMAEALSSYSIVTLEGRIARLRFPYDPDSVRIARALPRAEWDDHGRTWSTAAKTDADVAAIAAAVEVIQRRVDATREEASAKSVAKVASVPTPPSDEGQLFSLAACRPALGVPYLHDGRVVVPTRYGRTFVVDEDMTSYLAPNGTEGERACFVQFRSASEEEAVPVLAQHEAKIAKANAAEAVERMRVRVTREGEVIDLGREPDGEVMARDDRSAILGYRTWTVLDAEGGLWAMSYDGADGSTWGMYNCGYNTRGSRLQLTSDEIAAYRAAIAGTRQ